MKNTDGWDTSATTAKNIEKRFWDKVKKTDYCWEWTGYRLKSGHGQFGTSKKVGYAYRFSWELHNGKIPKGKCILHKCDNGGCVNPEHLFIGTQADNVRDMHEKNRGKYSLTKEQVTKIKQEYQFRKVTQDMLASKYSVSRGVIGRALNNKHYKHYE